MIATLLPLLLSILSQAPAVIEDVKSIWTELTNNETPTVDQQAQIDAALDAAHQALQQS